MKEDRSTPENVTQLRAAFALLSENAVPGPDCPTPDSIWETLRGGMSASSTATIVEHTSRCHACAEAWRLGRELMGEQRVGSSRARAMWPGARSLGVWASLAAAALVIVAVGIGVFLKSSSQPPDVLRAGAEADIQSLLPETVPLPRAACVLKWSVPAEGARYTIRVATQDLSPIASARDLAQPAYQVPMKSLEALSPGATIVWRVEADLPDGRRIASQAFMNRIE